MQQAGQQEYPVLRGRRSADVAVIGGGLTGITVALWLCKAGLRVALAEAGRIGRGTTAHCAGLVSLGGEALYERLERKHGLSVAAAYADTQLAAFRAVRDLAREQGVSSGWVDTDAQIVAQDEHAAAMLLREASAMQRAGIAASLTRSSQCPFPMEQALEVKNMGQLSVLSYLQGMLKQAETLGLKVFEHSRVTALETNIVYTERGSILAPYIVVATGYPIVNTPGQYFLRLMQKQVWQLPLYGELKCEGAYLAADGRYTLCSQRGSVRMCFVDGDVGKKTDPHALFSRMFLPWLQGVQMGELRGGAEVYSGDGLPIIGPYSNKTPNLFVATGYNVRGLLGSMLAAQTISARILGLPDAQYRLYGRRSTDVRTLSTLAGRYVRSYFSRPTAPYCPHMGCKLMYNTAQRLWECPCHGARFDDIGHVLSAPAVRDAQITSGRRR